MNSLQLTKLACALLAMCSGMVAASPLNIYTPPPISSRQLSPDHILPADVLARARLVKAELDVIRLEMGKPLLENPPPDIANATPREVFFQAKTLYNRLNRLSSELTGAVAPEIDIPNESIKPYHVWRTVDESLKILSLVKQSLGATEKNTETRVDERTTPTDVYKTIVQANREVNQLLATPFAPSDVFQQATQAVNYAAALLARYDSAVRIPVAPALIRKKQPNDVQQKLMLCYGSIYAIAKALNLEMLQVKPSNSYTKNPSDVYDFTSLIIAELDYLHKLSPSALPVRKSYYPGFKTPSQVFQRVDILEQQLELLERYVKQDPDKIASF